MERGAMRKARLFHPGKANAVCLFTRGDGHIRAAFYPNPTEAVPIVSLVRDFKLTMLAAPPTFLEALLERADGKQDLVALRYAFVGAEKYPEHVYRAFAARTVSRVEQHA
jgi:phenylacetate-coenzyme A ligase PaaK-like adenylate-forming protein